jgi:DegV family protein with EDD domain
MKNTAIIIDTSAPFPPELIKKFGFISVDFKIDWDDQDKIPGNALYEKMRTAKKMGIKTTPKTSQPSIGVFKKAFEDGLNKASSVIAITISSGLSGTYNSALQAKNMFDETTQKKIFVIDSYTVDCAEALLVLTAAEMDEKGFSAEEIVKNIEESKDQAKLFGMIESPFWLETGGRLSHNLAVLMEQVQKIGLRPVLSVVDGVVKAANFKMQAKDTAEALFKQLDAATNKIIQKGGKIRVVITHFDNLTEAEKLKNLIQKERPQIKIDFINIMGPVIACHTGPGTLLVGYTEDKYN